jgi:hypothetical protein
VETSPLLFLEISTKTDKTDRSCPCLFRFSMRKLFFLGGAGAPEGQPHFNKISVVPDSNILKVGVKVIAARTFAICI